MLYAVSAIGRDQPGIVSALSGVLLGLDGNIDDSQMSILHGHFAVMLIVSVPDAVTRDELAECLDEAGEALGLAGVAVSEADPDAPSSVPTHVLSVYGADHPGIVNCVTEVLAAADANITDMRTRRTAGPDAPLYVMLMEVKVRGSAEQLATELATVGERAQVEISLRELQSEAF